MKTYQIYQFLLVILLPVYGCQEEKEVTLTPSGKYTIASDTTELMIRSAQVLKEYLERATKASFEIVTDSNGTVNSDIILNTSIDLEDASTIQYFVKNDKLKIQGGSPKSVLNAVYSFLENEVGCRFYAPGIVKYPLDEKVILSRQLNYVYTPPITIRTVHSRLFYENHDFADARKVTYEAFPGYAPSARVHTFHRFVPGEKYYTDHPEYYALRNGKRRTTQLCLTNEEVYKIVRDTIAAIKAQYPEAEVISVSQDDNTQYCQCSKCEEIHKKEESPSGTMIHFVNRIARGFPDIQISTLAYQYTRKAPKYIKPEKNVLITLCSIECDRSAPIQEKCEDFTHDLVEWGKIADNIRIWDYTTQFTNFLAPFPNLKTLQPNLQLFRDNNAKWVFEQHSHQPSELFELRSYLTAKMLWNPDIDFEEESIDFLNGYYGEAGPFVKQYIDEIHQGIAKDSSFFLFLYGDPSQAFGSFLDFESLSKYDQLFLNAIDEVKENPDLVNHVNAARLSTDYAILEHAKTDLRKNLKEPFYSIEKRLNRFISVCEENRITMMNEMRYSVGEYIELYQKTIERAKKPNIALGKEVDLSTKPKKYANENPKTLTDGAFGGASFYSNWLGFEGNNLEAVIDLGEETTISNVSTGFLQVTNHIVFFPEAVQFSVSSNGQEFKDIGLATNQFPLHSKSKVNDIQYYEVETAPVNTRFLKIEAINMKSAPDWHNAAGLPTWIFIDEVQVR